MAQPVGVRATVHRYTGVGRGRVAKKLDKEERVCGWQLMITNSFYQLAASSSNNSGNSSGPTYQLSI